VARTPFKVEILTPEGEVFNDEVEMVSTRTTVGSIGLLANHQPLLAMLDPTELRLYSGENDFVTLAQGEGYLQVQRDSRVLILVDEAGKPEDLDSSEWEEKRKRAEQEVSDAEDGSHAKHIAERAGFVGVLVVDFTGRAAGLPLGHGVGTVRCLVLGTTTTTLTHAECGLGVHVGGGRSRALLVGHNRFRARFGSIVGIEG